MSITKNRIIDCHDDMVFLWLSDRLPTYTDKVKMMKPILEMLIWSWHWKADGRIGAVVSKAGQEAGITSDPYIYQLRWAAEYYGAKDDLTSISMALRNMREDFQRDKINLVHLDNNYRNCCLWNLSAMTRSQNARKQNLTAGIYEPFFWFSVNMGNSYRIMCGDDIDNPRKMLCIKNEEYLEILKRFREAIGEQFPGGQRMGYEQNGSLTDMGERIIQYLLTAPDKDFEHRQFQCIRKF